MSLLGCLIEQRGRALGKVLVTYSPVTDTTACTVRSLLGYLSPGETARMLQLPPGRCRMVYALAHLLLRGCLATILGRSDGTFAQGIYGKPVWCDAQAPTAFDFNLTHTSSMVACAFAWGVDVGIDAEPDYGGPDALQLANQFFTSAECAWLASLSPEALAAGFATVWTMKEAVLKAQGLGLHGDLRSFSVSVPAQAIAFHLNLGARTTGNWRIETRREGLSSICVAVRDSARRPPQVVWEMVDAQQLHDLLACAPHSVACGPPRPQVGLQL